MNEPKYFWSCMKIEYIIYWCMFYHRSECMYWLRLRLSVNIWIYRIFFFGERSRPSPFQFNIRGFNTDDHTSLHMVTSQYLIGNYCCIPKDNGKYFSYSFPKSIIRARNKFSRNWLIYTSIKSSGPDQYINR